MKKGSALYLTLIVVSIISAIAFGISSILFSQLKLIRGMGHSVVAFYNADKGIEHYLYKARIGDQGTTSGSTIDYDYNVIKNNPPEEFFVRITVIGKYQETKRGIQVQY